MACLGIAGLAVGLFFLSGLSILAMNLLAIGVGLTASLVGALVLPEAIKSLKDVFSSPVIITGQVVCHRRRIDLTNNASYHLTVGSEEFEVTPHEYDSIVNEQVVTVAYWLNTRIVESLARAAPDILPWVTTTVVRLAQGILEERAYDRLPILADAMEESGCTDVDLLRRCRQPGSNQECYAIFANVLQQINAAKRQMADQRATR